MDTRSEGLQGLHSCFPYAKKENTQSVPLRYLNLRLRRSNYGKSAGCG